MENSFRELVANGAELNQRFPQGMNLQPIPTGPLLHLELLGLESPRVPHNRGRAEDRNGRMQRRVSSELPISRDVKHDRETMKHDAPAVRCYSEHFKRTVAH